MEILKRSRELGMGSTGRVTDACRWAHFPSERFLIDQGLFGHRNRNNLEIGKRAKVDQGIGPLNACSTYRFLLIMLLGSAVMIGNAHGQENPHEIKTAGEFVKAIKQYRYLDPDSAVVLVKAGLEKAALQKDEIGQADLLTQYGMILDNAGRYWDSRQKYLQAEALYKKNNHQKGLASVLIRLGVVEKRKANYDHSLAYFMQALKLSTRNRDSYGILEARVVISENYLSTNDYRRCLENLRIAERLNSQMPFSNLSLNMYISYGYLYIRLEQYDKAIEYISLGLSKSNGPEYNGSKVSLLKQLGTAYFQMGDPARAVESLKLALSLAREIKNVMRQMTVLQELANIYAERQPDAAIGYLEQALEISSSYRSHGQQTKILNRLSILYKKKGDFRKALAYLESSQRISEEVYYSDMAKQISSLEKAYELEKSRAQLIQLKIKASEEAGFKKLILAIAVAIAGLFVVTLVYFYKGRRLNKLLSLANGRLEESNLQKDRFFSILAHDIRSPLGSTVTLLRFIADKELEQEYQDRMVQKLILHCENSLEVLDKLLTWGQMQIKGVK
ncbi:MAG: tetratricopeptide repeat protein, partial [Sphingobacteriales bacterium]